MSYAAYVELIDRLHAEGKVTGAEQSDDLLHYSQHNRKRMERLDKTFEVNPEISAELNEAVQTGMVWLTITEGWCGDASQIVPVLEAMAVATPHVQHLILLRDEHLDVMDQFLTNGGRAIPKTILLHAQTGEVLGSWGPRPDAAQEVMVAYKADISAPGITEEQKAARFEQAKLELHTWYARNKGADIQTSLLAAVKDAVQRVEQLA
jgi:hypothetical protein